jgi:hypothetical protein
MDRLCNWVFTVAVQIGLFRSLFPEIFLRRSIPITYRKELSLTVTQICAWYINELRKKQDSVSYSAVVWCACVT